MEFLVDRGIITVAIAASIMWRQPVVVSNDFHGRYEYLVHFAFSTALHLP
jgi:hypothetical protein